MGPSLRSGSILMKREFRSLVPGKFASGILMPVTTPACRMETAYHAVDRLWQIEQIAEDGSRLEVDAPMVRACAERPANATIQ